MAKIEIGQVYGKRTVVAGPEKRTVGKDNKTVRYWMMRCECGAELAIHEGRVKQGQPCAACSYAERARTGPPPPRTKDWAKALEDARTSHPELAIGHKIGPQEIIEGPVIKEEAQDKIQWLFRCRCGRESWTPYRQIRSGKTAQGCSECRESVSRRVPDEHRLNAKPRIPTDKTWHHVIRSAGQRQIPVELTMDQALAMLERQGHRCALSGVEIAIGDGRRTRTASLDRKDSRLGYTLDNVQWVHKDVNRLKNAWSDDQLIHWCKIIADHSRIA